MEGKVFVVRWRFCFCRRVDVGGFGEVGEGVFIGRGCGV